MYLILKIIHSTCALISILGFAGRGYLKLSKDELPRNFAFRVLPHIIDTLLLVSAASLVILSGLYPFVVPWVTAKLIALIAYIYLGIKFMRSTAAGGNQGLLYAATLLSGAYILAVAITKSPTLGLL